MRKHREKTTVNQLLQEFKVGERVVIDIDSSVQDGMPHLRYQGKTGVVGGKRGECYEVSIVDGGKAKTLICNPAHLKRGEK